MSAKCNLQQCLHTTSRSRACVYIMMRLRSCEVFQKLGSFQMNKYGPEDLCLFVSDLSQEALHNSWRTTASTVALLLHNTALHLALCTEGTEGISSPAMSNIT